MSNSPLPVTPTDHAMNEWSKEGKAALGSESKGGVTATFDTLMEELACKIQGKTQTVRQFAAKVEAAVISIHQSHPAQMSESCMMQVKRTQFFHGLKRTYKETFRHLYEEEDASFERILQAASIMEEALGSLIKNQRVRSQKNLNSPPGEDQESTPHLRRLILGDGLEQDLNLKWWSMLTTSPWMPFWI